MSDADCGDRALVHSLAFRTFSATIINSPPGKPRLTAATLAYLLSVGLVGAITIICFGVAAFSFDTTDGGVLKSSGLHDRSVAASSTRSDAFSARRDAAAVLPSRRLPYPIEALPASPMQSAVADTRSPEASTVRAPSEPWSIVNEGSATKRTALGRTVPMTSITAEQRDQLFHEFEHYHTEFGSVQSSPNHQ
jgi:hypothetical protein